MREGRGGPRGGLGTRVPLHSQGSGGAQACIAQLCAAFACQALELARDPGGAGRAGGLRGRGAGGGGGRGRAEVTPGSAAIAPLPVTQPARGRGLAACPRYALTSRSHTQGGQ